MVKKKTKTKPKKSTPLVESDIFDSTGSANLSDMVINIHGHPTAGKTWAACSASAYWPKDFSKIPKSGILLRDVLHNGWDKAALVGLLEHNIRVAYAVDIPALIRRYKGDLMGAIQEVINETHRIVDEDEEIKVAITDTATRMDKYFQAFWNHRDNVPLDRNNNPDQWAMYRAIRDTHHLYQSNMTMLPEGVLSIFCFHQKVLEETSMGKDSQKKADKARKTMFKMGNQQVNVVPDIVGQSLNVYTADASLELVCTSSPNGKGGFNRALYPVVIDGQRAKNRFEKTLVGKQPADLGAILRKLRRACT
jgi:hypothetical protein